MTRRLLAPLVTALAVATAIPAYAYVELSTTATGEARAATLGEPVVTVNSAGQAVTLAVAAPEAGPAPSGYTVASGETAVCRLDGPGTCTDEIGLAAERAYTVTAHLGTHWQRSLAVNARTSPPAPGLALAEGSDTGVPGDGTTNLPAPELTLTAPAASGPYSVDLFIDDTGEPFATVDVPPAGKTSAVTVPGLADGPHQVRAVATAHGLTAETSLDVRVVTGALVIGDVVLAHRDGVIGAGDSVTVSFSRPLDPRTVCAAWDDGGASEAAVDVTLTPGAGSGPAELTVTPAGDACGPGSPVRFGTLRVDPGFAPDGSRSFPDSTLTLDGDGDGLVLVLGAEETGPGGAPAPVADPIDPVLVPATGLRDHAGNPLAGDAGTGSAGGAGA